jgi:hypothetical protein
LMAAAQVGVRGRVCQWHCCCCCSCCVEVGGWVLSGAGGGDGEGEGGKGLSDQV